MSRNIPEILAPAGSPQQLLAAVRAGADAVYLGALSMNARRSAANFDNEQLSEAVSYCHIRGVRVYVTMNTLLTDDELKDAAELLKLLCSIGVDGVIVQDLGLADMIAHCAPGLPLHASTQLSVHTAAGVNTLGELGFCRVVLARELSADELKAIAEGTRLELECFVHGALCMSVSGQCYMSAMLGSRSGNRGRCAQPCRLPYVADGRPFEKGGKNLKPLSGGFEYCLSLKDNSLIPSIKQLAEMGISSLKIEGRMKRPEYCALAVDACIGQRPADGEQARAVEADIAKLAAVFSRSGFTDGYFTGGRGRAMFGHRTKEDVVAADSASLSALHSLYKNEYSRVPISMKLSVSPSTCELTVSDADGHSAVVSVPCGEPGVLNETLVRKKLEKTGGTPYISSPACIIGEGGTLSPGAAGELRRQVLEQLSQQRGRAVPIECTVPDEYTDIPKPHVRSSSRSIDAVFRSASQMPVHLPGGISRMYLPLETPAEQLEGVLKRIEGSGIELALEAPRGMFGQEARIRQQLNDCRSLGIDKCMTQNLGAIEPILSSGMDCIGGFGLNVTNTRTILALERLGLSEVELSFELTLAQIAKLGGNISRSVIVYGHLPLMLTRNCPAALGGKCRRTDAERGACSIIDRMGISTPVMCRAGCSEVFNSIPVSIVNNFSELLNTERFVARFTVENSVETERILSEITQKATVSNNYGLTRGLYHRGVE